MLCELIIENVAVIEKANIIFTNGFTCLTGETGAGKSIIVDSINIILGERISKNIVRAGAQKATITAVFENLDEKLIKKALDEYEIDLSNECIVTRQTTDTGKSSARINSLPVAVNVIKDLFSDILTIHGQHDNQSLLNPAKHIDILDTFGTDINIKNEYLEVYKEYSNTIKEIKRLTSLDKNNSDTIDLYTYQINEILTADLSKEEEEDLAKQKKKIQDSEKLLKYLNSAYVLLAGEDEFLGALASLDKACDELENTVDYDEALQDVFSKVNDAFNITQESLFELKRYLEDIEITDYTIDEIEERLDIYYKLKNKYGNTTDDVLAYCEKIQKEVKTITFLEEELELLNNKLTVLDEKIKVASDKLSNNRLSVFNQFAKEINSALEFLNMPSVEIFLSVKEKDYTLKGKDEIEFLIVTNKGENPKPLSKIASGGELSRIMLSIKSVLAEKDDTKTLIFDEIDAGVSGSAAFKIGKLLKQTAKGKQVLCVTHSSQIAAFSDNHLLIKKTADDKATYTNITALSQEEKEMEIARIISGDNITKTSLENAKEMIITAQNS